MHVFTAFIPGSTTENNIKRMYFKLSQMKNSS